MAKRDSKSSQSKRGMWKKERASVTVPGKSRPRSAKYSSGDSVRKPARGTRERVWVGGYTRADGTKVKGYYRKVG